MKNNQHIYTVMVFSFFLTSFETGLSQETSTQLQPSASPAPVANKPTEEKKFILNSKGKRVTVIDFEEAAIDGQAKTPEGMLVQSRQSKQRKSFLEARIDFAPEILSSLTLGTLGAAQAP